MSSGKLPSKSHDFFGWYNEVIYQAQLVDESPTRGCVVLRPYGYALWENIVHIMDKRFKEKGIENAYFPLLIPESFLKKEAKHVEGFSPELAVVTHAGGKQLEEPYVIRPTSETIIYHMMARWITSWRDLPMQLNQWANVVRWEMRTRPFLRTSEFLWQEGHTAHATREEALEKAKEMLGVYIKFITEELCIPIFAGEKTPKERFAGGDATFTMEGMMPDGKALQMGTSHLLAHSFPAAYGVQFQDKDGQMKSPWCTSWGTTTRMIGAAVMVHGDDAGLVLPPAIAQYQVVIVPIFKTDEEKVTVLAAANAQKQALENADIRVHIDARDERPGAKFFHWELRGVPIRLELGPRDVAQQSLMMAPRIVAEGADRKITVAFDALVGTVHGALKTFAQLLFTRAKTYRDAQLSNATKGTLESFGKNIEAYNGFVKAGWCFDRACEEALVAYKGSIRCILDEMVPDEAQCFGCQKPATHVVLAAKSY
ncbi:MAG: prolyl-tRNA synthetase [Candidatus Dependentiae bacterium]|nr:prolyl-tRNA synthetase [Candidatus Dependentiae bacterium]